MNNNDMEKDWLFGNSAVAILGALLWGTVWHPSAVEEYTDRVAFLVIGAILVLVGLFFGWASIIPLGRNQAVKLAVLLSPTLKVFTLLGFIATWVSEGVKLPEDQWWTEYLMLGGTIILAIVFINTLQSFLPTNSDSSASSKSANTEITDDTPRPGRLFLGGAVIFLFVLISMFWPVRSQSRRSSG